MSLFMATVGWLGTALYLAAQMLLALFDLSRFRYVMLNAAAALASSAYSVYIWSIQAVCINVVWTALSLAALRYHGVTVTPPRDPVAAHRRSLAIVGGGAAAFAAAWLGQPPDLWVWLSWLSFWLYSAAYFTFIFVGLRRNAFLALCITAASALIPQLVVDGNQPVLVVQGLWIVFSAVGLMRGEANAARV